MEEAFKVARWPSERQNRDKSFKEKKSLSRVYIIGTVSLKDILKNSSAFPRLTSLNFWRIRIVFARPHEITKTMEIRCMASSFSKNLRFARSHENDKLAS